MKILAGLLLQFAFLDSIFWCVFAVHASNDKKNNNNKKLSNIPTMISSMEPITTTQRTIINPILNKIPINNPIMANKTTMLDINPIINLSTTTHTSSNNLGAIMEEQLRTNKDQWSTDWVKFYLIVPTYFTSNVIN